MEVQRLIKAVAFDLRGTLVDPTTGWQLTDRERIRFLRAHGAEGADEQLQQIIDGAVRAVNALARTRTTYFEQDCVVLERAARRLGVDLPPDRVAEFERWRNHAFTHGVRAYPDAAPTLRALRQRGLATACVADGRLEWTNLTLERTGLRDLIDVAVASEETGQVKASGSALRLACERLRFDPQQILYVGDRMDKDVDVARRVGSPGLLLVRSGRRRPGQLASLSELLGPLLPARARATGAR
jgi:putative hydrolase of the HAD superfamily